MKLKTTAFARCGRFAVAMLSMGAAVPAFGAILTVTNRANVGGGIPGGTMSNTILAGNCAPSGADGSGPITSNGYNLIQETNGTLLDCPCA